MEKKQEPGSVYLMTLRQNEVLKQKLETSYVTIAVVALLAFLLGAGWFFCKTAEAGGFAEVGKSNFIRPAEFIFWQGPYPHEFQTDSNYFRVGYEKGPWRVSWFSLGDYKTLGLATSDEARLAEGHCNASTCSPPEYYETRGSVRGLLFSGVYRKGPLFFEGGASVTRQKFYILVRIIDARSGNAGDGGVGRVFSWEDTHTAIGYMASVGAEYKNFTFSFAYWLNGKASEFYAAGNTPGIDVIKTLSVGYKF